MITLKEHNYQILKFQEEFSKNTFPIKNNIECPKCGEEMYDSDGMILLSDPPKKNIHCDKCGHRDFAFC